MSTIFEISKELDIIFSNIEENDGEITPELQQQLEINEQNLSKKLEAYYFKIKEYKSKIDTIKAHIQTMKQRQEKFNKIIERLESVAAGAVMKFGDTTKAGNSFIETDLYKASTRKSEKLVVLDENFIPDDYKTTKLIEKVTIDKMQLKKDIKSGLEVAGAIIEKNINLSFK
jgi:hypothetical protein